MEEQNNMPTQLWMLNYGYKVKVLEGKNKGKEGYIVMDSRFGDVRINIRKKPTREYQIREYPSNLEILSMDNQHNLKPLDFWGLTEFDSARFIILIYKPEFILKEKYKKYFDKQIIESAELSVNAKN